MKILVFIVSYNAENFIRQVLERIPKDLWEAADHEIEVLVIDDRSSDQTFRKVVEYTDQHPEKQIKTLFNPQNQGYGGNQKIGYRYAIQEGFEVVVLLHGDGQYAPELLPEMFGPIASGQADVVLGSRMLDRLQALRGKMPVYKWVGNQVLTTLQNALLGTRLAEFHTGYRAYRVASLAQIPYQANSNYFDFDTDILIQLIDTGQRIAEIPIPTYYGDEISHVNGLKYAFKILAATVRSRIMRLGLLYDPKFDYDLDSNEFYTFKAGFPSSHQFAIDRVAPNAIILDLGCGPGYMAKALSSLGASVVSVDRYITPMTRRHSVRSVEADVEKLNFRKLEGRFDVILLMDIIEHLNEPEKFLARIREKFGDKAPPEIILTTGNVGFIFVRLGLFLGQFNYGKMGILDRDHKRLFTFGSMKRLLESAGFRIIASQGIPAPFPLAIGDRSLAQFMLALNRLLITLSRGLFSYQLAFVAYPLANLDHLLADAMSTAREKKEDLQGEIGP